MGILILIIIFIKNWMFLIDPRKKSMFHRSFSDRRESLCHNMAPSMEKTSTKKPVDKYIHVYDKAPPPPLDGDLRARRGGDPGLVTLLLLWNRYPFICMYQRYINKMKNSPPPHWKKKPRRCNIEKHIQFGHQRYPFIRGKTMYPIMANLKGLCGLYEGMVSLEVRKKANCIVMQRWGKKIRLHLVEAVHIITLKKYWIIV